MPAQVILTITRGPGVGHCHIFTDRTTVLIGRDPECHLRFPKDKDHGTVSRHHCLLDINPPEVCIRDLGSRNGTHVNGRLIGKRDKSLSAAESSKLRFDEVTLKDGDKIKVGRVVLQVAVVRPALCADCGAEIPEDLQTQYRLPSGAYCCDQCHTKSAPDSPAVVATPRTPILGNKANPEHLVRHLLELAQNGVAELRPMLGYRLVKPLGRGGMGAVFLAVHEQTRKHVALKVLLPQVAATKRMRDRFLREADNMKVLLHRNVVTLHDFIGFEGTFLITLEYCDGGSVADLVKRHGKLTVDGALPLIRQALAGLEYAHQVELPAVALADGNSAAARGLVHRDIKPANLFLATDGTKQIVKIGDYGLAKAFDLAGLSGLSMSGEALGTPVFMARQQVTDYRNARPEVDVWATAATLYYLLTLQYPRNFNTSMDKWQVVLRTNAIPIRQRDASVPGRLAEVINAALVDKPEIGFKTAAAFRAALEGAI
jgi:serine/threonine-protein kinase